MKSKFNYQIGDRVAERPKTHGLFTTNVETRMRIAQYRTQRYGTVVQLKTKTNAKGAALKILSIKWDHLQSPTDHAQMRICPIEDLQYLTKNTMVPGE